jgi:hypothetical protein
MIGLAAAGKKIEPFRLYFQSTKKSLTGMITPGAIGY